MSAVSAALFERQQLTPELTWLNAALSILVARSPAADDERVSSGWFVTREQALQWLREPAGQEFDREEALWFSVRELREAAVGGRRGNGLGQLVRILELSEAEEIALVLCLAAEMDSNYGRICGFLHDDLTRRGPSLDIAARVARGMFGAEAAGMLYDPQSALLRWSIVRSTRQVEQPLQHEPLMLDEGVRRRLLCTEEVESPYVPLVPANYVDLCARLATLASKQRRLVVLLHGPAAGDAELVVEAVCGALATTLRRIHADRLVHGDGAGVLQSGMRDALLDDGALCLQDWDRIADQAAGPLYSATLGELLSHGPRLVFVTSRTAPAGFPEQQAVRIVRVPMPLPDYAARVTAWREALGPAGQSVRIEHLATRFRFTCAEIRSAVQDAESGLMLRDSDAAGPPGLEDLRVSCRAAASGRSSGLSRRVMPKATWDALVLPAAILAQLRDICTHIAQRNRVLYEWGFDAKLSSGKGLTALFVGPSGTGKTLAAEVITRELGVELLRVHLPAVVSKYIGETEKNLSRIFEEAEHGDAILFFDEADALFGKRSEVRDAHDRYANIEINYLLQRLDEFEGAAILATNLAQNMDESFTRRIHLTVEFPFPDATLRAKIWRAHIPPAVPVAPDLNTDALARLPIAGGNIRNVVWNAAFLAAGEDTPLAMRHLLRAAQREYDKMGKLYDESEFTANAGKAGRR